MLRFDILTLFPEVFEPYLSTTIVGRAREQKLIDVRLHNIRDYTTDKHKTVDDIPYGGGAGMVMKIEPIDRTLSVAIDRVNPKTSRVVVLSARGQQFTQAKAEEYSKLDSLILICGRYEGIDQRVIDHLADEEISIGPYVLAGGELPAMIILEATTRLLPGVLGNEESLKEESHQIPPTLPLSREEKNTPLDKGGTRGIEYPQYTKPYDYKGWKVPKVLLSGNHVAIKKWRDEQRRMLN